MCRMSSLGRIFLSKKFHERMQVDRYPILRFIRAEALPMMSPGVKVLDAGSGRLPEQLMRDEILATGATLHTLDFCAGAGVDHVGDVSAMPFETGTYDIVLCMQVLEHVTDPAKVCGELARVIKPGGHVFVTAPQSSPIHNEPWNFFNFTRIGLELLFKNAGLTVIKQEAQGGHFALLAFELHWTARLIERGSLPKIVKLPLLLLTKIVFGFLLKIILLALDRWDTKRLNTQGWNFHGQKPA